MIDLKQLRESPEEIIHLIKKKDPSYDAQRLYDLDKMVNDVRHEIEQLRSKKNEFARQGSHGVTSELREASIQLSTKLKEYEHTLQKLESEFETLYLLCPNLPDADLPTGNKEANKVVKVVGEKPTFTFAIKNHVELGEKLGWFDFEKAAQIAGSNFALYKGQAVNLMYALALFMLNNNKKHGYDPVLPSAIVNEKALINASNFPRFKDQVYAITHDNLYLTPTAEVNLASMYADRILSDQELPIRMTAWTSCFRREAGSYGAHERGLIRIHQFEKVELYTICEPENSSMELDRMVACAEDILTQLGLHYRISLLAAQDCSFASAKTYDIEVWLPGQGSYYEVSSCSNCKDFQARRALTRSKKEGTHKTRLVHTLNGSSLALPRLMVALMEVYQQPDGSIALPKVLKKATILGC